jgi:hypothetical protein
MNNQRATTPNQKVAAFDIEIAKSIPDGETDWKKHRPLGITCAAIATPRGVWRYVATNDDGTYAERMTQEQARELANDLLWFIHRYKILTWNGLSFDFDVLAEESGASRLCADVATSDRHIDMMFHFFCDRGYPVGLDAVAKGLGLPGKPEGVSGALAPDMWRDGRQAEVVDYVVSDVENTLAIYDASHTASQVNVEPSSDIVAAWRRASGQPDIAPPGIRIAWTARSGRRNTWDADHWLSVAEALELPTPDTSWMSEPWPREKFTAWTKK